MQFRRGRFPGAASRRWRKPAFPEPDLQPAAGVQEKPRTFLGLTIKSIETLDEQSASGLLSKEGVSVLSVEAASYGDKAGLRARDVVIGIGNDPEVPVQMYPTAAALVSALQARRFQAAAAALTVLVGAASAAQIKVPAPVLGWASWNAFASSINFDVLKKQIVVYQGTP